TVALSHVSVRGIAAHAARFVVASGRVRSSTMAARLVLLRSNARMGPSEGARRVQFAQSGCDDVLARRHHRNGEGDLRHPYAISAAAGHEANRETVGANQ